MLLVDLAEVAREADIEYRAVSHYTCLFLYFGSLIRGTNLCVRDVNGYEPVSTETALVT